MSRFQPQYSPEFRRQKVELVRMGRTPEDLAREFEPHAQTIEAWVKRAAREEGKRTDIPCAAEREELIRLRRENHRLRQERDILSKAAAWFARESKGTASKLLPIFRGNQSEAPFSLRLAETLERAKGFEPSTPTLARSCSTTELRPLGVGSAVVSKARATMQQACPRARPRHIAMERVTGDRRPWPASPPPPPNAPRLKPFAAT